MTMLTKGTGADGHDAVRMYPNNNLKAPVREFSDTFSGYDLLRATYGNK